MPSDPNAKTRVRIAFLLLFIVFSVGAYFVSDLSKLRDGMERTYAWIYDQIVNNKPSV